MHKTLHNLVLNNNFLEKLFNSHFSLKYKFVYQYFVFSHWFDRCLVVVSRLEKGLRTEPPGNLSLRDVKMLVTQSF